MKWYVLNFIPISFGCLSYSQTVTAQPGNNKCDFVTDSAVLRQKAEQYYPELKRVQQKYPSVIAQTKSGHHVLFRWPMRANGNYDQIPNYYVRGNGVDNDTSFLTRDYNCGFKTYNNHTGTDMGIWPFGWHLMNNNYVQAAAAAPGIVIDVVDNNNNSYNCACEDSLHNYIFILHADSSKSAYVHLKYNSSRVNVGDIVAEGQLLADVGSSGCSSGPHLHFEVRNKNGVEIDPWVGVNPATDCNYRTEDSWWQNQTPYYEPQINRLMTHGSLPVLNNFNGNNNSCSGAESINARNNFSPGDKVYLGWAMYDWSGTTSVIYSVFAPNGTSIYNNVRTNSSAFNLLFTYQADSLVLPANAPSGTYMFQAGYENKTYRHFFSVNCANSYNLTTPIISPGSVIAASHITSNTSVATVQKVVLQAGNYIQFTPGFTVPAGAAFKARIKDCNYSE